MIAAIFTCPSFPKFVKCTNSLPLRLFRTTHTCACTCAFSFGTYTYFQTRNRTDVYTCPRSQRTRSKISSITIHNPAARDENTYNGNVTVILTFRLSRFRDVSWKIEKKNERRDRILQYKKRYS